MNDLSLPGTELYVPDQQGMLKMQVILRQLETQPHAVSENALQPAHTMFKTGHMGPLTMISTC